MNTIIRLALAATLVIFAQNVKAQETPTGQTPEETTEKRNRIERLEEEKSEIENWEKQELKTAITNINRLVEEGKITEEEGEQRKMEEAQRRAENIQNQIDIINSKIALVERNGYLPDELGARVEIGVGDADRNGNRVFGVAVNDGKPKKVPYDRRTYSEKVFAYGLSNGVSDNAEIGDDFSIGKSRFFEWGIAWKTRVFENSGALHFKYGLSLQTNTFSITDNRILETSDDVATFEEFPFDLKKSRIRVTNLVAPLHFEFGGWKKEEKEDYVRYRLRGKFRMGIGGYVGVRLGAQQKLKYKNDGERIKVKSREDFGGDVFVYGISSYIRITGDLSLYGKYDLSSAFETRSLGAVNTVSLGLRLDL